MMRRWLFRAAIAFLADRVIADRIAVVCGCCEFSTREQCDYILHALAMRKLTAVDLDFRRSNHCDGIVLATVGQGYTTVIANCEMDAFEIEAARGKDDTFTVLAPSSFLYAIDREERLTTQDLALKTEGIDTFGNYSNRRKMMTTSSRSRRSNIDGDPSVIPYVFVAGIEGTGHHWYKALFKGCGFPCQPSLVGPLCWQRAAAVFLSRTDSDATIRRWSIEAVEGDLRAATEDVLFYQLNLLEGSNRKAVFDIFEKSKVVRPWYRGDGIQSYPNFWPAPNKAVQMPDLGKMCDALFSASRESTHGRHPQLRVVLTSRSPRAVIDSTCSKRNFSLTVGGCATEVSMLVLGASALAAQIMALPPAPLATCVHLRYEHLQDTKPDALARLGQFLGLHEKRFQQLVFGVNRNRPPSPRPSNSNWDDVIVDDLERAQNMIIRACDEHG